MEMKNVDNELVPDCCISCQEIMVENGTLACNYSGFDVLPFQKCEKYKRLKWYCVKEKVFDIAV